MHGHGGSEHVTATASPAARLGVAVVLVPLVLATVVGMVLFWSSGEGPRVQGAERVELVARSRVRCHPAFAELALVKARLAEFEALVESEAFDADGAELVLALPEARIDALAQVLRDISRGRMTLKRL